MEGESGFPAWRRPDQVLGKALVWKKGLKTQTCGHSFRNPRVNTKKMGSGKTQTKDVIVNCNLIFQMLHINIGGRFYGENNTQ